MSINYRRRLPADISIQADADEYIRPTEVVDADEQSLIDMIRNAVVGDTRRQPKGSGKDDPAFHEPHWGHTTGLLQGTLAVDRIEALPERFRVGLFATARSYPVVCRPNLIHDRKAGFAASRMALKLKYPSLVPNVYAPSGEAHELDLLLAEGSAETNGVGHAFFFRNAGELALFTTLNPPSLATLRTLLWPGNWGLLASVFGRLKTAMRYLKQPPATTTGWAGKSYFSAGPFALGDGAMKLCLRPRQEHALESADRSSGEPTERQRAALEAWVAAGKDAVFDLCIQLATPECIPGPGPGDPPKSVMVAEYCDLPWDETKSPYVAVGTLTFPASKESNLSGTHPWSPLQFNAWNTLPSMRPLGQLFRARRHVHEAHSEVRLAHLYDAQPGAFVDKAPFRTRADASAPSVADER